MLNRIPVPAVFDAGEGEHGLDLREILSFVWRQWKFILGVTGVVLVIGIVSLLRQTPLYTATAQVLLDPQREKAPGTEAILSDAGLDYAVIESQMAIIRSTVFLRRVVEKERLVADAEFGSGQAVTGALRPSSVLPVDDPRGRPSLRHEEPIAPEVLASVGALQGALAVARPPGQGYTLAISLTSTDPARAARLANAVAEAYLVDKLDTRYEAAQRASAWLGDRLAELRNQLRASEEAIAQFRAAARARDTGRCPPETGRRTRRTYSARTA
jgi:polysaccharide biosynthesis transport protein